ncbi:MAG: hypothetical protein ABIG68_14210 [Acidobacteriota bacterium]
MRGFEAFNQRVTLAWALPLAGAFLLLASGPGRAGQDQNRIAELKEKVQVLQREAEELRARRQTDAAQEVSQRIEQLGNEIRGEAQRREEGPAGGIDGLRQALEGLEHGMIALERLNRREELVMLRRVADQVRVEIGRREQERQEERGRQEREHERFIRQLEVGEKALAAFREANMPEQAERLERAIHSRRLELEGRNDEEARQIRARAPDLEEVIHLISEAAGLWDQRGDQHQAENLRRLAAELRGELRGPQRDDQPRRAAEEGQFEEMRQQMRRLSQRMERLQQAVQGLVRDMEALKRRRTSL